MFAFFWKKECGTFFHQSQLCFFMFSDKIPLFYEEIIIAITLFKRPFYIAHLMIALTTNNYSNLITVVAKVVNSRNEFLNNSTYYYESFSPRGCRYSRVIFDHYHVNVPKKVKNVKIVWHQQYFFVAADGCKSQPSHSNTHIDVLTQCKSFNKRGCWRMTSNLLSISNGKMINIQYI